jgi:hypothetical protein
VDLQSSSGRDNKKESSLLNCLLSSGGNMSHREEECEFQDGRDHWLLSLKKSCEDELGQPASKMKWSKVDIWMVEVKNGREYYIRGRDRPGIKYVKRISNSDICIVCSTVICSFVIRSFYLETREVHYPFTPTFVTPARDISF